MDVRVLVFGGLRAKDARLSLERGAILAAPD
jgi:hypothetical protein